MTVTETRPAALDEELLAQTKPRGRGPTWTEEAAVEAMRTFRVRHGRSPRQSEFRQPDLPSPTTVRRLFGTQERALRAAGIETPQPTKRRRRQRSAEPKLVTLARQVESFRAARKALDEQLATAVGALERELAR